MSDDQIISIYRSGRKEEAFKELVDSYSERLYWHLRRFTCSHEDTDDLLQDVFIKIWAALPSFRGEAWLFTWIYRIATNEALNLIRKNRLKAALSMQSLESIMDRKIDEDPYFNGDKLQRELQKAINSLPPKQKLVFNMRYFDDLKYEEISEILGTSVGALKTSYHLAYVKIKEQLSEKFTD